jgi:hypothetical protein
VEAELLVECADWIAEQMGEEGYLIAGELVELILQKEREHEELIPVISHEEAARWIAAALAADGVQAAPATIDAGLVRIVLEWEDDFLALAGRTRQRAG